MRFCGEMHNGVDRLTLQNRAYAITVADIALHEGEVLVFRDRLQTREVAGVGQHVVPDDYVAGMMLDPPLNEVAADKARSARDQHSTHVDFFSVWLIATL